MEELNQKLNQLGEIIKKLIGGQIDCNAAHAKELEKRKKDRKKELSNFHRIYAEKNEATRAEIRSGNYESDRSNERRQGILQNTNEGRQGLLH